MSVLPAEASTAQISGDFVVFIIGVAVHNWWDVRGWWPVVTGFSKMMQELKVLRCTSSVWRGHTVHVMADSVDKRLSPVIPAESALTTLSMTLQAHPESGYMGGHPNFSNPLVNVQYWRSIDSLMDYAR